MQVCVFIYVLQPPLHVNIFSNEKPFLFEIVANKRNGIDVDK